MQTDHIDLYQMHHVDRDTPWDEIWQAMDLLVAQGKVIYVGSSNFAGWHIVKANEAAARRNSLGLVSEQSLYNLNARTVELEVLPACADYGVGVIPWSPLAGGILGGALQKVTEGRRARGAAPAPGRGQPGQARGLGEAVRRHGQPTRRCRPGLAAPQPGRDRADHRAPDRRPARRGDGRAGRDPRAGRAGPARQDLPRSGRTRARGVRLVDAQKGGRYASRVAHLYVGSGRGRGRFRRVAGGRGATRGRAALQVCNTRNVVKLRSVAKLLSGRQLRNTRCESIIFSVTFLSSRRHTEGMATPPAGQIVDRLAINDELVDALISRRSPLGVVLSDVIEWEAGSTPPALQAGIDPFAIETAYVESIRWANAVTQVLGQN